MTGDGGWNIRRAESGDLERLARLEASSFADPWSAALLGDELAHPAALILLAAPAIPADAPASGYASFRLAGGEAELLRLAVEPALRGQGLGTTLAAQGLARLREEGVQSCHLEVRAGNAGARAVYLRLGFALTGRRPGYYRDGSEALLYTLPLTPREGGSQRLDPP